MKARIKIYLLFIICMVCRPAFSQCPAERKSFAGGEVLTYKAYYNWGFIWLHAGKVEFRATGKKYMEKDVFHLYGYGTTYKSYDWIFKVREKYQAYVDTATLMPLWYERDVIEDNYTAFEDYKFDYENHLIHTYVQKRRKPGVKGTLPLTPCLLDVMSAVYYFRCVDFEKYGVGDKIPINMVIDSEAHQLHIRYLGKEEVKTRDKVKYNCIKFAIQLVEGTIFKGDEDAVIWVTDDKNKVPVMVEAQILVGSVKAILDTAEGLKY